MIHRTGIDHYTIRTIGDDKDLSMSGSDLCRRLYGTGFWSHEQIFGVLTLPLYGHTVRPHAVRT